MAETKLTACSTVHFDHYTLLLPLTVSRSSRAVESKNCTHFAQEPANKGRWYHVLVRLPVGLCIDIDTRQLDVTNEGRRVCFFTALFSLS